MQNKPNCYNCIFRGDLPGNAHSRCNHPIVKEVEKNPKMSPILTLCAFGIARAVLKGLEVEGNEHGQRMGWFCWPLNFDPIWLEECSGYQPIKKEKDNENMA